MNTINGLLAIGSLIAFEPVLVTNAAANIITTIVERTDSTIAVSSGGTYKDYDVVQGAKFWRIDPRQFAPSNRFTFEDNPPPNLLYWAEPEAGQYNEVFIGAENLLVFSDQSAIGKPDYSPDGKTVKIAKTDAGQEVDVRFFDSLTHPGDKGSTSFPAPENASSALLLALSVGGTYACRRFRRGNGWLVS
jgi:hypothetical protein